MTDILNALGALRRPKLLLQAARLGLKDYDRGRILKRAAVQAGASPKAAINSLMVVEENLELARQSGDASYVPSRHVDVLVAILAEVKSLVTAPRAV
ncbi:MAG: DUF6477 family protein [Pseudomonadota bacterium]